MSWQLTPYFLPLLLSAAISSAIAVYSWRYRTSPGSVPLAALMTAAAIWSAAYAMELGSAQLSSKLFFTGIEYMGIASLPLAWLVLSLQFSGRDSWISYRRIGLMALIPVIILARTLAGASCLGKSPYELKGEICFEPICPGSWKEEREGRE